MVISIKDVLLIYYNLYNNQYIYTKKDYCLFKNNDTKYILRVFENNNSLFNLNIKIDDFHLIVKNKYKKNISNYNNLFYVLLKINNNIESSAISFKDLINISNNKYLYFPKIDYFNVWKNKIDFLDNYYKSYYEIDNYDFNYFRCLSEISLNIIRNIKYQSITYGVTYNRFYNIENLYDLYDPFNATYGPIVNSFAEYIKYRFFYNNEKVSFLDIFDINLNENDYYYFIARLIFPTYYFDLLKNNRIEKDYQKIINNYYNYVEYIKSIILEIKKRHDMPFLNYIINLL